MKNFYEPSENNNFVQARKCMGICNLSNINKYTVYGPSAKDLLNKFNSEKIIYLENINNIKNYLNKDYKYVFSLMSSKDLNPIKNIIIKFFNKN